VSIPSSEDPAAEGAEYVVLFDEHESSSEEEM
jgi:hypothetical protein